MGLTLAVAAKGACDPREFFDALGASGLLSEPGIEIVIAHDAPWSQAAPLPGNARLLACPAGTSILKLWGIAMAGSAQPYVAALDIRCPPRASWWARARQEIENGTPVFFGPVDPGWGAAEAPIAGYLAEYVQFHSPLAAELNEVPGNNIVCRRDLLDAPEKLAQAGFFKTFMVWRLERELGLAPRGFDDLAVVYRKPFAMRHYAGRRYVHGRCFAACRFDNPGQPPRLICLAFTPLLPLLRLVRIYRAAARLAGMRRAFFRQWPRLLLSEMAWSAGELMGYAFGGRGFCERLD